MPDFYFSMSINKRIAFAAVTEASNIIEAIEIVRRKNPEYTIEVIEPTPKIKSRAIRFTKNKER